MSFWTVNIPEPDYENDSYIIHYKKLLLKNPDNIRTTNDINERKSYLKYHAVLNYFDDDHSDSLDATYKYNFGYIKRKLCDKFPKIVEEYYRIKRVIRSARKQYELDKNKDNTNV